MHTLIQQQQWYVWRTSKTIIHSRSVQLVLYDCSHALVVPPCCEGMQKGGSSKPVLSAQVGWAPVSGDQSELRPPSRGLQPRGLPSAGGSPDWVTEQKSSYCSSCNGPQCTNVIYLCFFLAEKCSVSIERCQWNSRRIGCHTWGK